MTPKAELQLLFMACKTFTLMGSLHISKENNWNQISSDRIQAEARLMLLKLTIPQSRLKHALAKTANFSPTKLSCKQGKKDTLMAEKEKVPTT